MPSLCKKVVIVLAMLIVVGQIQAFSLSGDLLEGDIGFFLSYCYAVPTTFDTFYIAIANPFNLQYSFANLDSGGYLLFAYQDLNTSLLPDLDEPRGFYGENGIPALFALQSDTEDVNITLMEPNTGGFSGTVTYAGTETGATYVAAFRTPTFSDTISGIGLLLTDTGNGAYTAFVDSFGVYYAYAFMDLNTNFVPDANEPYGVYGGATPDPIEIEPTDFPTEIDITMEVINSADRRRAQLPSYISIGELYPNPFNNQTVMPFTLALPADITVHIYDVMGRAVGEIARGRFAAGSHSIPIGAQGLATGLYYVELRVDGVAATRRMVVIK